MNNLKGADIYITNRIEVTSYGESYNSGTFFSLEGKEGVTSKYSEYLDTNTIRITKKFKGTFLGYIKFFYREVIATSIIPPSSEGFVSLFIRKQLEREDQKKFWKKVAYMEYGLNGNKYMASEKVFGPGEEIEKRKDSFPIVVYGFSREVVESIEIRW